MKTTLSFLLLLCYIGCDNGTDNSLDTISSTMVSDAQLFQLATTTTKAAFFNNKQDTIPGNSGAAHSGNILVWYNAKAKEQLDANGRIKTSAQFADSSLIVKEIFNLSGERQFVAAMFKLSSATNKSTGNWVWAEFNSSGQPYSSTGGNGAGCIGCHSTGIDFTLTNSAHP